jgi:cation diffusion facilitator family transporter
MPGKTGAKSFGPTQMLLVTASGQTARLPLSKARLRGHAATNRADRGFRLMARYSSRTAIIAALVGNLAIAITKGFAAAVTGSSAMISESVHSLVDTGNEVLLLYGQHRAGKPPDDRHPYGYGRELYFWCFVVALLIFAVGAGVSIYEGVIHIRHPEPIARPWINFAVLGIAMLFEGASWRFAWHAFSQTRGEGSLWTAFADSKDPTSFMVLFEDSAALVGIGIAAIGTALSVHYQAPWIDGASSILIGMLLAIVAVLLARESKELLIGERASPELSDAIRETAAEEKCVLEVVDITTSQLSPDQVIATLGVVIDDRLRVPEVEQLIHRIEKAIRARHPQLFRVFVRPQPKTRRPDPNSDHRVRS